MDETATIFRPALKKRLLMAWIALMVFILMLYLSLSIFRQVVTVQPYIITNLILGIIAANSFAMTIIVLMAVPGYLLEKLVLSEEGVLLDAVHTHIYARWSEIEKIGYVVTRAYPPGVLCLVLKNPAPEKTRFRNFFNMLPQGHIPVQQLVSDEDAKNIKRVFNLPLGQSINHYAPNLFDEESNEKVKRDE